LNTKNLEGIIRKFDRKLGGHRNKALSWFYNIEETIFCWKWYDQGVIE
jgi:hypothetical protein